MADLLIRPLFKVLKLQIFKCRVFECLGWTIDYNSGKLSFVQLYSLQGKHIFKVISQFWDNKLN